MADRGRETSLSLADSTGAVQMSSSEPAVPIHYLELFLTDTNQRSAILQHPLIGPHTTSGSWQGWVKLPLVDVFYEVGLGLCQQPLHLSVPQQKRATEVGNPIWHRLQQELLYTSQCLKCEVQPGLEMGIWQQY